MTYEIFLMRVMHRTGIDDRGVAQELTHHTVKHLAHCLDDEVARELAELLPAPLASDLEEYSAAATCELDALYHSVADRLSVDLSFGLEFTQVVLQVFGEALGPTGRKKLCHHMPAAWHPLFEPRQTVVTPRGRQHHNGRSLSSAQPGSSRPLSEAQPGHRNSIARTAEPHLGTRLSTSHGKPQRRTLATGRPGSSRPISDA